MVLSAAGLKKGNNVTDVIPKEVPEDLSQATGSAVLKNVTTGELLDVYPSLKEAQEDFKVVYGGAESPASPSAGPTAAGLVSGTAIGAFQGSKIAGLPGAIVGGTIGALGGISNYQAAQDAANKAFMNDPERVTTSALEPVVDQTTGKTTYKVNKELLAKGNSLSGNYVKQTQETPEGETVRWGDDGRLKINVSTAFANSDVYKDIIDDITTNYGALTKELDDASEGKYLEEINKYIAGEQSQFLYAQKAAANFEQQFPAATTKAIDVAINNQKIGLFEKDEYDKDYQLTLVEEGEYKTKSAKEVFDTVYNFGDDKIAKDEYMAKLSAIVVDPTVDADHKAVTQGVINAIYGASNRDSKNSKYAGMLEKDFWDYLGTNVPIAGFSVNEIVSAVTGGESYGDLKYFQSNDLWDTVTAFGGAAVNVGTSMLAMNAIESGLRHIPGLSKLSAIAPQGAATAGIGQAIIGFGFNAASDAVYEGLKYGLVKSRTGAQTTIDDFWADYLQDLAMDLVVSGASTANFRLAMDSRGIDIASNRQAAEWAAKNGNISTVYDANGQPVIAISAGDVIVSETTKTGKVEVQEAKVATDDATAPLKTTALAALATVPTTTTEISQPAEVKPIEYELSQSLTKAVNTQISKQLQNKKARGVYQRLFDKNIALREIGYEATGITGDNGYLMKISENAQDVGALIKVQQSDYMGGKLVPQAQEHWTSLLNSVKSVTGETSKTISNKLTKGDRNALSTVQDAYLNARQQISRAAQNLTEKVITKEQYDQTESFYNKWINAVDATEQDRLDRIYDNLATVSSDIEKFRIAKELVAGDDAKRLERFENYIPLWADNSGRDTGAFVANSKWKKDTRTYKTEKTLMSPESFQSPVTSVAQMFNKVLENAARNEQVKAITSTIDEVPALGITYAKDIETNEPLKELTESELVVKYEVPDDAKKDLGKVADSPSRYKNAVEKLDKDNHITDNIEEYAKAREAYRNTAKKSSGIVGTLVGDPILGRQVASYKEGMTLDEMNAHFLDSMSLSIEGMLNDANKSERKKGFPTLRPQEAYTKIMQTLKEMVQQVEFKPDDATALMADLVRKARPYHDNKTLTLQWIKQNSDTYIKEKLSDQRLQTGEVAYDLETHEIIDTKPAGYPVQFYTGGKKTTIYLDGVDESHKQIAKEISELLNLPVSYKQKTAIMKLATGMARLKRNTITALDPTHAFPNFFRDQPRATVSSGGNYLAANNWLKLMAECAEDFGYTKEQLSMAYADIDRIHAQNTGLTQESIIRQGTTGDITAALQAINAPKPVGTEFKANANMLQRTAASLKHQFDVYAYDIKNIGKGGGTRLLTRLGDTVETATRNRAADAAYGAKLIESLNNGKSFEEACADAFTAGSWAGRNNTTSFGTKGAWTEAAAKYAPYSFSSFSSRASQIESFAADPLGVSVNFFGFLLGYTMSLASILAEEESRKKYMNLDDYTRSNNILIPIDSGAIITIPMDDELAGYVSSIRMLLEGLSTQAPTSFWTVIGAFADMSSFDLSGFTEGDKFNLWRGLQKGVSQYAPSLLTAAGEIATGTDWYYGSSVAVDDEYLAAYGLSAEGAGDYTTTSNNSKTLHEVADVLGIPQWIIQQTVESIGGNVGQYALYVLDKLRGATEEDKNVGGKDPVMALVKPFTGADASNIKSTFYDGISELKTDKEKLLVKLAANKKKQTTATGNDLTKLQQEHTQMIQEFTIKAGQWVNQYLTIFEMTGGLSHSEAMQVYYLFDFSSETEGAQFSVGTAGDYYASKFGTQEYYQQVSDAAGILDQYYDQSQRIYKAADGTFQPSGSYGAKAVQNSQYNKGATYTAGINALIQKSELKDGLDKVYTARDKIYAKGKLTDADYKELDRLATEWDAKVTKVVLPYFQQYGLDPLASSQVIDYLDNYYIVPSSYMLTNYGKRISASRLNKQRGFAKSYIQSVLTKLGVK